MADSAIRQLAILAMLPRHPRSLTTTEVFQRVLSSGYDVTSKTVERDLQALERQFMLICESNTKPYRWCFQKQAAVNIPSLSIEMALTFHLIEKHAQSYLPKNVRSYLNPYFQQAGKTISSASNNRLSKWKDKVHVVHDWLSLLPPKQNAEVTQSIYEAVIQERKILADYLPRGRMRM